MAKIRSDKEKMNTLLSIGNYFGEYSTPIVPWLIFFGISVIPLFIWLFIFKLRIPLIIVVPFELVWTGITAMIILGNNKKVVNDYIERVNSEYSRYEEINSIKFIHDDGMVELDTGQVFYILEAYPKEFLNEARFSAELEDFYDELDVFNWDNHLYNDVDEIRCEDRIKGCGKYKDKEIIRDRLDYYELQDNYTRDFTELYRFVFIVMVPKSQWKTSREHIDDIISSKVAKVFNEIKRDNPEEVNDILSRDTTLYVNLSELILAKHTTGMAGDNKMMWYGDKIPEEYKKKEKKKINLAERRTTL